MISGGLLAEGYVTQMCTLAHGCSHLVPNTWYLTRKPYPQKMYLLWGRARALGPTKKRAGSLF